MSEFVDECRREWKRLGVADHLADEMAAELSADLDEAEAEGASAAEVLGSSASDPRSLAASWALERGLVQPQATERVPRSYRPMLAAVVTIAFLVVIGGAVAILASETGQRGAPTLAPPGTSPTRVIDSTSQTRITVLPAPVGPRIWGRIWFGAPEPEPGDDVDPIAWTLLAVGVVGIAASLLWTLRRRGRPPAPA